MTTVLLLEDDPTFGKELFEDLEEEGCRVRWARTLAEGIRLVQTVSFDLGIFDVTLPDGLVFDFCRDIRNRHPSLPLLILTSRMDDECATEARKAGASDFVRKSVGRQELLARIRRHL